MRASAAIICLLIAATAAAQTPDPENAASLLTLSIDPARSMPEFSAEPYITIL